MKSRKNRRNVAIDTVESVKELKKICGKKNVKETGLPRSYREISFYFTKILLYFRINANQVSLLGVEIGLIASIFFIFNNPLYFSLGGALLFFYALADYCDGEVARYYNKSLISGKEKNLGGFFDWANCIPRPFIFLCLTISFLSIYNTPIILFFGIYTSVFLVLNHCFNALRNSIFEINSRDSFVENIVNVKISNTFNDRYSRILCKAMFFIKEILKKFKISRFDFKKGYYYSTERDRLLYKIRCFFRRTQSPLLFPFIFIFTGISDFLLSDFNYFTFSVWIYFGISGTILFILEEYLIRKGELRNRGGEHASK